MLFETVEFSGTKIAVNGLVILKLVGVRVRRLIDIRPLKQF